MIYILSYTTVEAPGTITASILEVDQHLFNFIDWGVFFFGRHTSTTGKMPESCLEGRKVRLTCSTNRLNSTVSQLNIKVWVDD